MMRSVKVQIAIVFACAVVMAGCGKSDDELMTAAEQQAAHSQWTEAMENYRTVLARHPDGPRAPEALYKSGMILYSQLKNIAGGAKKFIDVTQRFPKSDEAPKSLMVLGFMYAEEPTLRNLDSARTFYKALINGYPQHELVAGARIQLEHLGESPDAVIGADPGTAPDGPRVRSDTLAHSPGARAFAH